MSPEEKELLRRSLTLSEENNRILRKVEKSLKWQAIWSIIKILIVVVPLVLGYVFFQPYFGTMFNTYKEVEGMINNPENPSAPSAQSQSSTSGYLGRFFNQIN
ncbi:hypothetical protein BH11PAT3_BH11PAT3_2960 [soil metagenome]